MPLDTDRLLGARRRASFKVRALAGFAGSRLSFKSKETDTRSLRKSPVHEIGSGPPVQSSAEAEASETPARPVKRARGPWFVAAVFVSRAGAASEGLHPTPIEAQPSRGDGRTLKARAAKKLIRALVPAFS